MSPGPRERVAPSKEHSLFLAKSRAGGSDVGHLLEVCCGGFIGTLLALGLVSVGTVAVMMAVEGTFLLSGRNSPSDFNYLPNLKTNWKFVVLMLAFFIGVFMLNLYYDDLLLAVGVVSVIGLNVGGLMLFGRDLVRKIHHKRGC